MNLEDRNIEDIDMQEEYEMVPFVPIMYGHGQMSMNPNMDMNPNMGMYSNMDMNQNMDMNPDMGMNPWMGMNPCMGMNPWMGMGQFSEGMFMNGSNPMGNMYEDASMKDFGEERESLRQEDNYGDNEPFRDGYNNPNRYNPKHNDVDTIVRRIERYNPAIFKMMTRCGMPFVEARGIVRRIVKLTLMYSEE